MASVTATRDRAKEIVAFPEAGGSEGKGVHPSSAAAIGPGSEDHVSEMMGWLRLTAVESAAVVLDDGGEEAPLHSKWVVVGKVLSPTKLHISTIAAALRPAWGNPRGLLFNPVGDNMFVAEFGSRADKERVKDGPPWVVGKHVVLLQEFNVDLKPQDMIFNCLKLWARIMNLPFGYMNKKWSSVIAKPLGVEGSVPVVDCDSTGRCWGNFMRVKVVVDTDKPLLRGVTIFSQRRNLADWFDVQYEQLPHYCFSCGLLGHSSIECKTPGVGEMMVNSRIPVIGCVPLMIGRRRYKVPDQRVTPLLRTGADRLKLLVSDLDRMGQVEAARKRISQMGRMRKSPRP
jgi:hypothetical protein